MPKREPPQMVIQRFKSLDQLDEIERGTTVYRRNDQTKFHWEMSKFTVKGADSECLLLIDTEGHGHKIPFESLGEFITIKM